jgi:hypothetical protein
MKGEIPMWESIQSYGIWIVVGIAALYLLARGCGRGAGMGCGGHGRHSYRQGIGFLWLMADCPGETGGTGLLVKRLPAYCEYMEQVSRFVPRLRKKP